LGPRKYGLNRESALLARPIFTDHIGFLPGGVNSRQVLILSGINSGTLLYF